MEAVVSSETLVYIIFHPTSYTEQFNTIVAHMRNANETWPVNLQGCRSSRCKCFSTLRLLFRAAIDTSVQMDVFPQMCAAISAALLTLPAAGICGPAFPSCWQRMFYAALLGERHFEQSRRFHALLWARSCCVVSSSSVFSKNVEAATPDTQKSVLPKWVTASYLGLQVILQKYRGCW